MRVLLAPEARRQFDRLPTFVKVRMVRIFDRLRRWPSVSGAKRLRGLLSGQYRMRTGDYRIQFQVQEDLVILKVGHRDGFYDE